MKFIRLATRIALILVTAALFVALASVWADSIREPEPVNTRRASDPQFRSWTTFFRQCAIVALIAVAGRKVLRVRL